MKLVKSQLLRLCGAYPKDRIGDDVRVFNEWADEFNITSPLRIAHFFAQLAHESGGFSRIEENMNYSAERLLQVFPGHFNTSTAQEYARQPERIASRVYANRMGNGSEASGDGWDYRGRGYIQLTGRANYQAYARSGFCVGDLMSHPEWLCNSPGRMKASMWFWWKTGCNKLADADDVRAVTKKINGGYNGLSDRMYYLRKAKKIFLI